MKDLDFVLQAFAKEILEHKLEKIRIEKINSSAIKVQAVVKACWRRKYYLRLKIASLLAQKLIRVRNKEFRLLY